MRAWLAPVRAALGAEFVGAYLTGSVLTQGFDPAHSRVNVLVVARSLDGAVLERLRHAIPTPKRAPHFDPLFLTREQVRDSLDSFPIELLEIRDRHLRIEGEDLFSDLEVPRNYLRLQCEHELRGKLIQLRQAYLATSSQPLRLVEVLHRSASSYAALFRTLLRLRGEVPPANTAQVIERIADLFKLDAQGLLGAHLVRTTRRRYKPEEILAVYRKFLAEADRLVTAIDALPIP